MEMPIAVALTAPLHLTLLLLLAQRRSAQREPIEWPLIPSSRIDLDAMRDVDALRNFRFTVAHIRLILTALRLPEVIITRERDRSLDAKIVAMLLMRLCYPCRLSLLRTTFGRSEPGCCLIVLHTGMCG